MMHIEQCASYDALNLGEALNIASKNKFMKEEMAETVLRAKEFGCQTAKTIADEPGTSIRAAVL